MDTLQKIFAQTLPPEKVLIIDNGATDETKKKLEELYPEVEHFFMGYNAGPGMLDEWNTRVKGGDDPLLFMESIPYWETRGYVAIVMRNYWMYERQADSDSPSRKALAAGQWPVFPGEPASGRVWLTATTER